MKGDSKSRREERRLYSLGQAYLIMRSSLLNYHQVNGYIFFVSDLFFFVSFILLCCDIELVASLDCL
jgi:hypothetical protein